MPETRLIRGYCWDAKIRLEHSYCANTAKATTDEDNAVSSDRKGPTRLLIHVLRPHRPMSLAIVDFPRLHLAPSPSEIEAQLSPDLEAGVGVVARCCIGDGGLEPRSHDEEWTCDA